MSKHNIPFFIMRKKNTLNDPICSYGFFFLKGLKNEFERAVVNEPSVLEPLKFYCIWERAVYSVYRACLSICMCASFLLVLRMGCGI